VEITPKFTDTQKKALTYLTDNTTNELLFGGGAGGGKSFCGCAWLIISCLQYPTTRYLLGRSRLDALKKTTLNTFFEVCGKWEIKSGQHYMFNAQSNIIKFYNGSEILLKDMFLFPSDPNFDSLGSLELTGAFIDEANQITQKAKNIVLSRIRFRLDENNLIPKLLLTCNPAKNWLYSEWYIPNKQNILGKDKRFLQSLVTDNPNISKHYIETLSKMDTITKERLLYGNWEYDDTEGRLFKYDNIINLFTNTYINEGEKYISVDVARFGKDSSVICVWSGWVVVKIIKYNKIGIDKLQTHVLDTAQKHKVQRSNIVLDEDGVGGGLKDILRGSKGFINNSKALGKENYQNLKTQCYYKFADKVNKGEIFIKETQYKQDIIQELEIIQMKDVDKDNKLNIVGKDKMKEHLGRSPDIADALMMRCYFELNKTKITYFG